MSISELFDNSYENDVGGFNEIPDKEKLHPNKFVCGILKISSLLKNPSHFNITAEHDIIYLPSELDLKELTQDDVDYLSRCGFGWNTEFDCLFQYT